MGDMRIMLVDDNGDLRRGMRDYLARQEGMKVVAECPSGAEALEALGKVRVDVMVLDLIMPQMDGFALMEAAGESAADYRCIGAGARRLHHARGAAGRTVLHGQAV